MSEIRNIPHLKRAFWDQTQELYSIQRLSQENLLPPDIVLGTVLQHIGKRLDMSGVLLDLKINAGSLGGNEVGRSLACSVAQQLLPTDYRIHELQFPWDPTARVAPIDDANLIWFSHHRILLMTRRRSTSSVTSNIIRPEFWDSVHPVDVEPPLAAMWNDNRWPAKRLKLAACLAFLHNRFVVTIEDFDLALDILDVSYDLHEEWRFNNGTPYDNTELCLRQDHLGLPICLEPAVGLLPGGRTDLANALISKGLVRSEDLFAAAAAIRECIDGRGNGEAKIDLAEFLETVDWMRWNPLLVELIRR